MKDVLINTSNLHAGGGVQVATSAIAETSGGIANYEGVSVLLSTEVKRNLDALGFQRSDAILFETLDVHGIDVMNGAVRRKMDSYKVVFTLFGPLYRWKPPFKSIVGFAQPWIIYTGNECYGRLPFWQRVRYRLKFWVQGMFFKRADVLVVELEHVKEGLIRELRIAPDWIHVIYNCLSSIYASESLWEPIAAVQQGACNLRLGFVGRNHLHKNTVIFPAIVTALERSHGFKARFFVTFTDDEWQACSLEFRSVCVNVGPLLVAQCPTFYKMLDGVVFPSLLEAFSATPLEAMAMERPLFASNRSFIRDVCHSHATYFDPLSPDSAAAAIAKVFANGPPDEVALRAARDHAFAFSSAKERAEQYLALMRQASSTTKC